MSTGASSTHSSRTRHAWFLPLQALMDGSGCAGAASRSTASARCARCLCGVTASCLWRQQRHGQQQRQREQQQQQGQQQRQDQRQRAGEEQGHQQAHERVQRQQAPGERRLLEGNPVC